MLKKNITETKMDVKKSSMTEEHIREDCPHLYITDEGVCTLCGVDTTSQEFLDSLPEAPNPDASLGDIVGIVSLIETVVDAYLEVKDPHNPNLPKLRFVGNQIMRIPDGISWTGVCQSAYSSAKTLGYRGTSERWEELCTEFLPPLGDKP
jgi:hypothetical protein